VRILVTGGAGFIGHHLVRSLLARGHEVSVIDDYSSGHRSRLEAIGRQATLVEGNILNPAAMDEAAAGCEVILHHAAIASVAKSTIDPRLTNEANVSGTIEVMLAAARNRVRRVVFAGSSAIYGVPKELPCREAHRPDPQSPYGVSKLAGEQYVRTLGELHGVETVILRYFNVFGPGQDPTSEYAAVVPRFIAAVLDGSNPVINGSGEISRDYVYVDDVVEANLLAANASCPPGLTANIASGSSHSLLSLLAAVGTAAGRRAEPWIGPPRPGDIMHSRADISIAQRELGYTVSVPFPEGIARTVAWFRGDQGPIRGASGEQPPVDATPQRRAVGPRGM
jgi:UDP-glucose 4-epimerase